MSTPEERQGWPSDELVDQAAMAMHDWFYTSKAGVMGWPRWQEQARAALSVVAPLADLREVERLARENKQLREQIDTDRQRGAVAVLNTELQACKEIDAAKAALVSAQERVAELERLHVQAVEVNRRNCAEMREALGLPVDATTGEMQAEAAALRASLRLCQEDRDTARAELGRAKNGARWLQERLESLIKEVEERPALVIPADAAQRFADRFNGGPGHDTPGWVPLMVDDAVEFAMAEVRSWSSSAVQGEPAATFNLGQETDMATYARLGGRVPVGEPARQVCSTHRANPDAVLIGCGCNAPAPAVPVPAEEGEQSRRFGYPPNWDGKEELD